MGKKGEDIAAEYLKKKGYKILERNYRKQYAEIDSIVPHYIQDKPKDQAASVFIEVKTRTSNASGTLFEAITSWKLRPVTKLAEYYQLTHPLLPNQLRIDAIAIVLNAIDEVESIEHMENISGF